METDLPGFILNQLNMCLGTQFFLKIVFLYVNIKNNFFIKKHNFNRPSSKKNILKNNT